jgi:hypothetical protein
VEVFLTDAAEDLTPPDAGDPTADLIVPWLPAPGMKGGWPGTESVSTATSASNISFRLEEGIMATTQALSELVDELYAGQERIDRDEIYRRAVAAELSSDDMAVLDRLPEGEYAEDELNEAIAQIAEPGASPLSVDQEPTD